MWVEEIELGLWVGLERRAWRGQDWGEAGFQEWWC